MKILFKNKIDSKNSLLYIFFQIKKIFYEQNINMWYFHIIYHVLYDDDPHIMEYINGVQIIKLIGALEIIWLKCDIYSSNLYNLCDYLANYKFSEIARKDLYNTIMSWVNTETLNNKVDEFYVWLNNA